MMLRPACVLVLLLSAASAAYSQPAPAVSLGRPRPLSEVGPVESMGVRASEGSGSHSAERTSSATLLAPSQLDENIRLTGFEPEPSAAERVIGPSFDPPPFGPPANDLGGGRITPVAPSSPDAGSADPESFFHGRPSAAKRTSNYEHRSNFGEQLMEMLHPGCDRECDTRKWFESDHTFDYFASPVTNPFFAEDPRSLTEVRPIFMFQAIPSSDPNFRGGNIEFFGLQARVAINERFSLVINKLGWVSVNPGSGSNQPGGTSFAEVALGPKFTFLRNDQNCLLGAAGLTFDIPAGPARTYQDTGSLSLIPYVTFAKNFLDTRFGSLNVMNTTGYSFATDRQRSDFLYNSLHVDFDVANRHRFYPLMELNYFQYTRSGGARNLGVEGRDLANLGEVNSGGNANFNLAGGLRYKFNERMQTGFAVEFPLNSRKDLNSFRLTVDFIWRY